MSSSTKGAESEMTLTVLGCGMFVSWEAWFFCSAFHAKGLRDSSLYDIRFLFTSEI
jgi:hypothetical protein